MSDASRLAAETSAARRRLAARGLVLAVFLAAATWAVVRYRWQINPDGVAYLSAAERWRAGWLVVGATPRLDGVLSAVKKLADGRLCSPGPMQHAVVAALTGDRSHQTTFRRALAERARVTTDSLNAIPGMRCVPPRAAFYAMPAVTLPPGRTDEDYVLALLRTTGILCVHGSGFGMPPDQGTFRVVFLANPTELASIFADIATFTRDYLARTG